MWLVIDASNHIDRIYPEMQVLSIDELIVTILVFNRSNGLYLSQKIINKRCELLQYLDVVFVGLER